MSAAAGVRSDRKMKARLGKVILNVGEWVAIIVCLRDPELHKIDRWSLIRRGNSPVFHGAHKYSSPIFACLLPVVPSEFLRFVMLSVELGAYLKR